MGFFFCVYLYNNLKINTMSDNTKRFRIGVSTGNFLTYFEVQIVPCYPTIGEKGIGLVTNQSPSLYENFYNYRLDVLDINVGEKLNFIEDDDNAKDYEIRFITEIDFKGDAVTGQDVENVKDNL